MINNVDQQLLEKVRDELWQIQVEKNRAAKQARQMFRTELAKNMKLDRHAIRAFTRQQIHFAEQLLGIN